MRQTLPINRFLTTILFLTVTTLTWAYDFAVDGIYYDKNSDGTSVTVTYKTLSNGGYSGSVVIPSTVTYYGKTYSVTSICDLAFDGCSDLTSVTIPNSVTSIGNNAFFNCSGLTSVTLNSNSIVSKTSFSYSNNFKTIFGSQVKEYILGDNITAIGNSAFNGCSGLTSVTIGNSVTTIGNEAFRNCSGLTSVTIPNSVTSIGNSAFYGCTGLTSITIPNSVTSIGSNAFNGCSGLKSVTIPNSVTSIGSYAFSGCSGLTSITIPNSVTSIGISAFSNCTGLTKAEFASIESLCKIKFSYESNPLSYAKHLYIDGQEVTDVVIPNSITSINDYAFYNCNGLTSVTIGNSVTSIGSEAFYGCTGLTSVTIPESVTSIGRDAFYKCSGLTKAEFASIESLCKIKFISDSYSTYSNPLYYAKHLYINGHEVTDVVIPNSITSINDNTFRNCSSLKSVTIPESVTSIGRDAFSGCTSLTKAEFASIESLCKIEFSNFSSNPLYYAKHLYINGQEVTDVVIPNSVTSIGEFAFCGCTGMTSLTIPNSVTSIGQYAFYVCALQTIINHCDNDIAKDVFSDRMYLHTQLYVPEGTVWDYIFNTKWGEFLHIKEFATSADDIRNDAVYMIADRSGRNFPVYDKSAKTLKKVSYTLNLDDSDTGACWQVIRNGSDTYLYNIGAGMYAAYDADDDLSLSIVPTALAIDMTEDGATINGKPVMLVANKSVTPIDNPTGIDTLQADEAEDSATQTVSHDDTAIYDLNGRRLHEKPARGFYIQGGKKYYGK